MNDFIENILTGLMYESENLSFEFENNNQQFKFFIKDHSAYFLISIDDRNISVLDNFLDSFQSKMFESALANKKFKDDLKKNSYLLVMVENSIANKYQRKFFINIEEDPFFFKKYVLRYNENDLKLLIEKTLSTDLIYSLGQLAVSSDVFNNFSEGSAKGDGYENLLYQVYIKIPALKLPTTSRDIESLTGEIQKALQLENLAEQNSKLWNALNSVEEKNVSLQLFKDIVSKL